MDNNDLANLVVVSNEAAMQWYSLVTQKAAPVQPSSFYTPLPGGGGLNIGTDAGQLLLIGVVILVAFMLLKD